MKGDCEMLQLQEIPSPTMLPSEPESETPQEFSQSTPRAEDPLKESAFEGKAQVKTLCKVRLWFWWLVCLGLVVFEMGLILTCLAIPSWVHQGKGKHQLNGGLFKCYDCHGDLEGKTYQQFLNQDYCDADGISGLCDTIENLNTAGILFLSLSGIALVFILLWGIYVVLKLQGRFLDLPSTVFYLLSASRTSIMLLAVALWRIISQARLYDSNDDCDEIGIVEQENICATDGPSYAISMCLVLVAVSLFNALIIGADSQKQINT